MATHSSILVWEIPWTEKPGELQSMGLERVEHIWVVKHTHTHTRTDSSALNMCVCMHVSEHSEFKILFKIIISVQLGRLREFSPSQDWSNPVTGQCGSFLLYFSFLFFFFFFRSIYMTVRAHSAVPHTAHSLPHTSLKLLFQSSWSLTGRGELAFGQEFTLSPGL